MNTVDAFSEATTLLKLVCQPSEKGSTLKSIFFTFTVDPEGPLQNLNPGLKFGTRNSNPVPVCFTTDRFEEVIFELLVLCRGFCYSLRDFVTFCPA